MNSAVFALYFSFHLDWEKKNRWIESMYTTSPSRRKTKVLLSIGYRKKNHFSLFPIRRLVDYYVDPLWRLIGNLDTLRAANTIPEFLHPFEPCTVRYWSKTISPVPFATNMSKNVNNSFKRCSTSCLNCYSTFSTEQPSLLSLHSLIVTRFIQDF